MTSDITSLVPGTQILIHGRKRAVTVTEVTTINGKPYAFTTSGSVRPSHRSGGVLWVSDNEIIFQATMQQQAVTIPGFEVV
jgi:hypothetical protein